MNQRYDFKNSSSADLVTRQVEPIFLPLRSPFSSVASTSASLTPRIFATSADPSNSAVAPAPAPEISGGTPPVGAAGGVVVGMFKAPTLFWPIPRPAPQPAT